MEKCRVAIEASLRQVVAWIVTEPQVTMLKPWRGRPHVYKVETKFHSPQNNGSALIITVCHSPFDIKRETSFIRVIACC